MRWPWGGVQRLGAVALVIVAPLALAIRCHRSPDFPYLWRDAGAPWITVDVPPSAALEQWGRVEPPLVTFERRFDAGAGGPAQLCVRALRGFRVRLNGREVPGAAGEPAGWRRGATVALPDGLTPGENVIAVDVWNQLGPALLSLSLRGDGITVASDETWTVTVDGQPRGTAALADDTRPDPASFGVETPLEALTARRDTAALLFTLSLLAFLAGCRLLPPPFRKRLPAVAMASAAFAWLLLFVGAFVEIPLPVGFDARHHLAYVEFLRDRGALPLATDGWSMYHPPLFYAVALAFGALAGWIGGVGAAVIGAKLPGALAGLATVAVAWALCRRLFPGDRAASVFTVLFAAALPMNLTVSAYFSNESTHALFGGLALVATASALAAPSISTAGAAAIGLAFGLALLTKFTSALVLPIAVFFLAIKVVAVDRAGAARAAAIVAAVLVPVLLVAGWFYARTWWHLGQPVVGNWDLDAPGQTWWQQPGFHTARYYAGFGESLVHPYLAGFHSFWDGIYSTLWGDGGIGGRVYPSDRHPYFDYELMSATYLLALPATAILLFGTARCGIAALTDPDPHRRAALSFVLTAAFAVGLSILAMTARLPYFGQAKAFYGLVVAAPISVFFGAGAARLDALLGTRGGAPARALLAGWFGLFTLTALLSFAGHS